MKMGEKNRKNLPESRELRAMKTIPAIPNPINTQLWWAKCVPCDYVDYSDDWHAFACSWFLHNDFLSHVVCMLYKILNLKLSNNKNVNNSKILSLPFSVKIMIFLPTGRIQIMEIIPLSFLYLTGGKSGLFFFLQESWPHYQAVSPLESSNISKINIEQAIKGKIIYYFYPAMVNFYSWFIFGLKK